MEYTDIIPINTPVVIRSYTSGVLVGRIQAGEKGVVVLTDWRHLREWSNVGEQGSVYNLINSKVVPVRSPLMTEKTIVQQADVIVVSEEAYERLAK